MQSTARLVMGQLVLILGGTNIFPSGWGTFLSTPPFFGRILVKWSQQSKNMNEDFHFLEQYFFINILLVKKERISFDFKLLNHILSVLIH